MKRIVSIILTIVLLLTVFPAARVCADSAFTDVPSGSWYEQAVSWAAKNGIAAGVGNGQFGPLLKVTRAQVVMMLWRIESSPEPSVSAGFPDVSGEAWYSKAVAWSQEKNLVAGYPSGLFAPNRDITRQELVTILYRFARYRNASTTAPNTDLSGYKDLAEVSPYALEAMRWAVGNGIASGTSAATLSPKGTATRAQLVQMLYRWLAPQTPNPTDNDSELPFVPKP